MTQEEIIAALERIEGEVKEKPSSGEVWKKLLVGVTVSFSVLVVSGLVAWGEQREQLKNHESKIRENSKVVKELRGQAVETRIELMNARRTQEQRHQELLEVIRNEN